MRSAPSLLLLWGVVVASTSLHAQFADRIVVSAPRGPDVQEIVRRAVANDGLRHQHRLALECDQIVTTERLNAAGAVCRTSTVRLIHHEGAAFAYFVKGDAPAADRAREEGDATSAEHTMAAMNLRKFAPRFECVIAAEASVQGRACYVVAYSPRRCRQAGTTEQKVLDQLHGRFWLDEKTNEILQGEGSLAAPVSVGPLASIQAMSFAFHTRKLVGGEVGPADYSVDYTVKAPFYFYRQRQINRLENWRHRHG